MTALTIMGLLPPTAKILRGRIEYRGRDILQFTDGEWRAFRGREAAMVFQNALSALNPFLRVGDQIADAIQAHADVSRRDALARAVDILSQMGIPNAAVRARAFPHQYSGGMAQRAMIGLALASDPQLVLADEPTTGLDPIVEAVVLDLLVDRTERQGRTLILVSHDIAVIARVSTRVVVMYAGEVLEDGPVDAVLRDPISPYTQALIDSSLLRRGAGFGYIPGVTRQLPDDYPGCVFAGRCPLERSLGEPEICRMVRPTRTEVAVGRFVRCHFAGERSGRSAGGNALPPLTTPRDGQARELVRAADLSRWYEIRQGALRRTRVEALGGVDLAVREGEILAVIGESGSGKSTLGRVVVGLERFDAGDLRFEGDSVAELHGDARREFRKSVQMVFQNPYRSFNPMLSIGASIAEASRITGRSGRELARAVNDLLTQVGLDERYATRYPREMSGGELQRAAIARALATEPRVIFLDEPTSALDASVRGQVITVLLELRRRADLALVLVSHELDVVRALADRVLVMYGGQVVEDAGAEAVLERPLHPYTRALIAGESLSADVQELIKWMVGQPDVNGSATNACRYAPRCPYAMDRCRSEPQALESLDDGHAVRCWRARDIAEAEARGQVADLRTTPAADPPRAFPRSSSAESS
jgi:peptide/nickel transport system ATP-binding protein